VRFRIILCFLILLSAVTVYGASFDVSVLGTDNIFTAGGNAPLSCCLGTGPDTNAQLALTFTAGPGQVLTFSSVTGMVGCQNVLTNGPDGTCFPGTSTNINSLNDISGIQANDANMFLVGVFLGPGLPGSAPASLDYNGTTLTLSELSYAPQIGQVFFIGDGLTGTGTGSTQMFDVPTGATRLFLGFADAGDFSGNPNDYGDNPGQLSVDGSIAASTPEPATWLTLGLGGIALLAIGRRSSRLAVDSVRRSD
jgi:hypothetical protein